MSPSSSPRNICKALEGLWLLGDINSLLVGMILTALTLQYHHKITEYLKKIEDP